MTDPLRLYFDPAEIGLDGYPYAWHKGEMDGATGEVVRLAIKDLVREQAGNRCVRCGHPYEKGAGEWSLCDSECSHGRPVRFGALVYPKGGLAHGEIPEPDRFAQWRILTVHHLNRIKHDCRWWNLAALCQRCHLTIQGKVYMDRPYVFEHSEWFKPYAAGFYAWKYLDEELSREETIGRLDELLALEQTHTPLF